MSSRPGTTALDSLWEPRTLLRVLIFAEALAFVLSLAPGVERDRWRYFLLASLAIQWTVMLTLGLLYLLRQELAKYRPVQIAYATLLLLVVATLLVVAATAFLTTDAWVQVPIDRSATLLRLAAISLTVGIFGLAVFRNFWAARQLAIETRQAQLEALRSRVQPHFLFNTLNTAVALVHAQPEKAEQVLMDLADLFRAALSSPRDVQLREEMEITFRYLGIESLRLGPRLHLDWRVPESLPDLLVPSLSIQPLVENAVRHGIEPSADGGEIVVEVTLSEATVTVMVANDVPDLPSAHPGYRVGLTASRERIAALGDGRGRLTTESGNGRHVVTIVLPRPR